MRVTLAVLADAANLSREGKLNILGVFSSIPAPNYPARHPAAVLVVRLAASASEQGQPLRVVFRYMDADKVLAEIEGTGVVPAPPPGQLEVSIEHLLTLNDLPLPHPGDFAFHVLVNGSEEAVVAFEALEVQNADADG